MRQRSLRITTLAAALLVLPNLALAQDSEPAEDPVLATVNGTEIHQSDAVKAAELLPTQYQSQFDQILPLLVERLVDLELIKEAAGNAGLADDEEVQARVAELEQEVMREVYLQRELEARLTDEALQEAYAAHLIANPPQTELNARHILVPEEADAKAIIAELDAGADFAELAKERSTGPSSVQGGDLGYFNAQQMVPEFSQVAFALEPGTYSAEPVHTQFGWHVIKVEDRRDTPPPAFEEVEPQLREEASRSAFTALMDDLRGDAEIAILLEAPEAETAPEAGTEPETETGPETEPESGAESETGSETQTQD